MVSFASINTMTKSNLEGNGLCQRTPYSPSLGEAEQGLEAGTEAEMMISGVASCLAQSACMPMTTGLVAVPTAGSALLHQASRKGSTGLPTDQSDWDSFSVEVCFSQTTLVCVKLTRELTQPTPFKP